MSSDFTTPVCPTPATQTAASLPAPAAGQGEGILHAEISRLRKALKPFAAFADYFDEGPGGHPRSDLLLPSLPLTVGHLFDARKVLRCRP